MAQYKIYDVSETVKDISGKFGPMKVFKLKLEGEDEVVDLMQGSSTPIPSIGDILEGSISHNDFGAFFRKDKKPFTPNTGSPVTNTDAMYVAYAKDLYVAYLNAINWDFTKLDEISFNLMLMNVKNTAKFLQEKT